ncbi:AbrB family transcriptional regulator [Staphylococcus saprophyticus]|uniref:AbrB/MazE/SpoVT family DNA-binding domain-containing protein n=1 Tax=Staphylococcus sp. GFQ9D221P TaxID=2804440 RepID=UPI00194E1129|nr:AbrB family transcriptional regulator [Staphylococcus sp. GFQ9D221P]MDW4003476.1 AbrB family transcriptional regulator [Staphylococcus saprophyticus]
MSKINSKIFKYGNSQAISLSKEALHEAGLEIGDVLEYYIEEDNKILFKKVEEQPYKELIKEYYKHGGRYMDEEINPEADEGK